MKGVIVPQPVRASLRVVAVLCGLALAGGLGWFAARETLSSSQTQVEAPPQHVVATVSQQTVGKALNYSVTATLPTIPVFYNSLSGTVTFVAPSGEFTEGQTLYAVDNVPVRAITSSTVFYRDLSAGTKGKDVAALQNALHSLGYLNAKADGQWGSATTTAVKAWQHSLGMPQSGVIAFGELVAVPQLPAALTLSDALALAAPVSPGTAAVSAAAGERVFYMALSQDQARMIPADTQIEILGKSATWPAVISELEENEDGTMHFILTHPNGGAPCQDDCGELDGAPTINLRAIQHVIPQVSGPGVPTIAVRTDDSGNAYVTREDGSHTPVTVKGSGGGFTIVDGLNVGDTVVALAPAATAPGHTVDPGTSSTSSSSTSDDTSATQDTP